MEITDYQTWVNFYMEFADALLPYEKNRKCLIEKITHAYATIEMPLPTLEEDNKLIDIDPFTVFGLFNKGISEGNRISILESFAQEFSIKSPVPNSFDGIPVVNNLSATFYYFMDKREDSDIDHLWEVFTSALQYTQSHSKDDEDNFINAYDTVLKQKGIRWNISMALYWIRPYTFINLDSRNRKFLQKSGTMTPEFIEYIGKLNSVPSGRKYIDIIERCRNILADNGCKYNNFPELSYAAWLEKADSDAIGDTNVNYWIYTPGLGATKWDEFYENGIMAIGREYLGNLLNFSTRNEIREKILECGTDSGLTSGQNVSLEAWEFANILKPGDIIFAKQGKHTILGRGIVTSDYIYDPESDSEYPNIRKVNWTDKGKWEHPGNAITKILTNVSSYIEYVEMLSNLFVDKRPSDDEPIFPIYTQDHFLNEVFMNKEDYEILTNLMKNKKNIILQGAPGVGKTFAAKRLAYSMMGEKDSSRVKMIQFHQSYSYEDFIMGFRPASTGFELKKGPFYNFCKQAEADLENDYFFIIDEINRGNLSKIFGELFMLIENDKRGVALQLLYSDELFSIPENVYIIGMMNTADRSLALLDYALRRRFAFFELPPAFQTEGFRKYCQSKNNKKFDNLIAEIEKLNTVIENDESLGKGFCIGHSYFCTDNSIDDMWLNAVITYEIIPLLKEYWFDEPSKVRDWDHTLHEAIK